MRKLAVLCMAALLPLSLLTAGASASPPSPHMEAPGLASVRADALTDALDEGRISEAEYALHRARSLSTLGAVRDEFGAVARPDPHAATLILRDLALRVRSLSGEERTEATGLLARPSQGGRNDGVLEYNTAETTLDSVAGHFRIHYVTTGEHKAELAYVTAVAGIMDEVWMKEVTQMGWRAPKSDQGASDNGGDAKFDVYLGNIGADGYYGYCAPDSPQSARDQHAYCVLDNDFSPGQFEVINGLDAARVTAAHEFNHAIQFAYDVTDDGWLLESTATWMEDEVYNDINDNYQYLSGSPLGRPQTPADTWTSSMGPDALFQYGTFIWMTYLSEKTTDPGVIRRIWEKTAEDNMYSLEAIEAVLGDETQFANSFNEFAAWNTDASTFYSEGAAYEAAVAPVRSAPTHTITTGNAAFGTQTNLDHLTSRFISFKRGAGIAPGEVLSLAVNLGTAPMQRASVVVRDGSTKDVRPITLRPDGRGEITVPFGAQEEIVLVLTNASNRMTACDRWEPGTFSCGGRPLDDNQSVAYSAITGQVAEDPGEAVDTRAPVVSNLRVTPNPVKRGRTANISFATDDAAAIRLIILRSGRKVLADNVSGVNRPGSWTVPIRIGRRIPTGKYVVKIVASDPARNKSTAKTGFRIK